MYKKYSGNGYTNYSFENQEFDQDSLDKLFWEENVKYFKGSAFPVKIIEMDSGLYYQVGVQDDGQLLFDDESDIIIHDSKVDDFVRSLFGTKYFVHHCN